MNPVIDMDSRRAKMGGNHFTGNPRAVVPGGPGDGGMDDVLKRLGNVEASVSAISAQVSGLSAGMPHLATKADVASIPHLATKADVQHMESSLIKWAVTTAIAVAALAFAIARFVL